MCSNPIWIVTPMLGLYKVLNHLNIQNVAETIILLQKYYNKKRIVNGNTVI